MRAAPSCVPVIFGPHVKPYCPAPSWWTAWHIAFVAAAACVVACAALAAFRRLRCTDRMPRADRRAWRSARTLEHLGRLGALWLEGDLGSQPAYGPGIGPGEETLTLIPVLAEANRAGFYTTASSPGDDCTGFDGLRWRQRAAVEGFASEALASRLAASARAAGLAVIAFGPAALPRRHWNTALEIAVTERDGSPYTWFGQQWSRREIRSPYTGWSTCRRAAQRALCEAWQVTIVDPEWGREASPLWDVLAAVTCPAPEMIP